MSGYDFNTHRGELLGLLLCAALAGGCAESDTPPPDLSPPASLDTAALAPDHIVVKPAPHVDATELQLLVEDVGGRAVSQPSYADFYYVHLGDGVDPVEAARRLGGHDEVVFAEADPRYGPLLVPNDPAYERQWHLSRLGMEQAWDINAGATSDVVVAVLDTGVAYHDGRVAYPRSTVQCAMASDLRGTEFVAPYDFVWDSRYPVDLDGHGTHVTGTIAQRTNNGLGGAGMAFNVSIMPVKTIPAGTIGVPTSGGLRLVPGLDEQLGLGSLPYGASTVARAIRYAVDKGADVINLSLGGIYPSSANREALEYAAERGVFVAIAAGNSAEDGNPVVYPARYAEEIDGVVAVGAVDYDLRRAPYSERGSYVEIVAPGGDTSLDANNDGEPDGVFQQTIDPVGWKEFTAYYELTPRPYDFRWPPDLQRTKVLPFSGTSMAAPHVAGLAALLKSQGLESPAVIEAAMKRFARDIAPDGRDNETGYGLINPRATLLGLGLAR